jgi:hypothetical protein
MKKVTSLTIIVLFILIGRAGSTIIKSNPPGAKLYFDGSFKGETPYTHTDRSIAGTWRNITLKKEGYKDVTGHIKREELSVPLERRRLGIPSASSVRNPIPTSPFNLCKLIHTSSNFFCS